MRDLKETLLDEISGDRAQGLIDQSTGELVVRISGNRGPADFDTNVRVAWEDIPQSDGRLRVIGVANEAPSPTPSLSTETPRE